MKKIQVLNISDERYHPGSFTSNRFSRKENGRRADCLPFNAKNLEINAQFVLPPSRLIAPLPLSPSKDNVVIPVQETVYGVKEAVLEIPAQSKMAALYKLDPASLSVIKRSDAGKATVHFSLWTNRSSPSKSFEDE